jgi:hypothetical protein
MTVAKMSDRNGEPNNPSHVRVSMNKATYALQRRIEEFVVVVADERQHDVVIDNDNDAEEEGAGGGDTQVRLGLQHAGARR